jgi:hypothetical protein
MESNAWRFFQGVFPVAIGFQGVTRCHRPGASLSLDRSPIRR